MITGIRQLRSATKHVLSAVNRGETVTITRRGKPYAQLSPLARKPERSQDRMFGMWKDRKDLPSVKKHMDTLRKPRHAR